MKKIMIPVLAVLIALCAFSPCLAEDSFVIETQNGDRETAALGDVITAVLPELEGEYTVEWYCGGEPVPDAGNSVTVTTEMLGKSVYAVLKTENGELRSNTVNVPAQVPTIELVGAAGDYSVKLNWSAQSNGSEITHFDISYALELTPDVIIDTVTLGGGETSYTVDELLGGASYIIRLTAYNEIGGISASVTVTPNDPDLEAVKAVKKEIESKPITIHMNLGNTEQAVRTYLLSYYSKYKDYGVKITDITVSGFKAAEPKTADDPNAETGSFKFIVELSKGNARLTTRSLSAVIDNSTSIVYLTADRFSALTGERITVTANKVDINSNTYVWYRAENETADGTVIENEVMPTYSPDTSKADDFYLYCVCGGISSERIRITVTDPFIKVADVIMLSERTVNVRESLALRAVVSPANATASNIVWSITDDGGCKPKLSGRTLTAEQPGTVTLCATVKNGLETEDYKKIFIVTVTDKAKETEPAEETDAGAYETSLKTGAEGVSSVSMTVENGTVQITELSEQTVKKLLDKCGLSKKDYDVVSAVKFVYSENAVAENVVFELTDKTKTDYKVITGHGNGTVSLVEPDPSGFVILDTVSPDTVIILKKNGMTESKSTAILLATAAAPVIVAALFIPSVVKNARKRKGAKK